MTDQVENSANLGDTKKRKTKVKSKTTAAQSPLTENAATSSSTKKTAKTKSTTVRKKASSGKSRAQATSSQTSTTKTTGSTRTRTKSAKVQNPETIEQRADTAVGDGRTRINASERLAMIEKEAYFLAEARGFVGGDPAQDWLQAEQKVDALLKQTSL